MIEPLRTYRNRGELKSMKYAFNFEDKTIAIRGSGIKKSKSFAMYEFTQKGRTSAEDIFELTTPLTDGLRNLVAVNHAVLDIPLFTLLEVRPEGCFSEVAKQTAEEHLREYEGKLCLA